LIRQQVQEPVKLVTPGVRSAKDGLQDQKRTLSAAEALKRGAIISSSDAPSPRPPIPSPPPQALMRNVG